MKISQEDTILIKIYMCQRDRVRDKGWKLGSIDSLLNRIRKSGKISRQPYSRLRLARIPTRTFRSWRISCSVRRTSQKRTDQIVRLCVKQNWRSWFKCAQDNSPRSPAQMIQTTRRSIHSIVR